ncbi:MAG TPA: hypothetical protein VEG29_08610 [Candidatus Binatia bacterium]|nr:hypothetical protein [Candidatus Binatia bacterium]
MQHSIAAKYAARPVASFVRPSSRVRERRLGLRAQGTFQAAPSRATVLRRADLPPLVRLRASWRAIRPATAARAVGGRIRPAVTMSWARSAYSGADRRSGAPAAPWHG